MRTQASQLWKQRPLTFYSTFDPTFIFEYWGELGGRQAKLYISLFFAGLEAGLIVLLILVILACQAQKEDDDSEEKHLQTECNESITKHNTYISY